MSKNELKKDNREEYKLKSERLIATLYVDSNDKIWCVETVFDGWSTFRYTRDRETFPLLISIVLFEMLYSELETFKELLKRIKDSEPNYFEVGMTFLNLNRHKLQEEAKKYSL